MLNKLQHCHLDIEKEKMQLDCNGANEGHYAQALNCALVLLVAQNSLTNNNFSSITHLNSFDPRSVVFLHSC
jgi:hypothetical protein